MAAIGGGARAPCSCNFRNDPSRDPARQSVARWNLSFLSSEVSGHCRIAFGPPFGAAATRGSGNGNMRSPIIVSPRAVSDSNNSQTCLDPEASRSILGIILGGGAGTRLIDIPVSNCLNCNISKTYVLTQFNSVSLNRQLSWAHASNMGGTRMKVMLKFLLLSKAQRILTGFRVQLMRSGSICGFLRSMMFCWRPFVSYGLLFKPTEKLMVVSL